MPCCMASVWKYCNVLNLSPLGLLETVKPEAILSRHALVNHALAVASAKFLNCPRRAAHVSRAAENNRIARVELREHGGVLVAAL